MASVELANITTIYHKILSLLSQKLISKQNIALWCTAATKFAFYDGTTQQWTLLSFRRNVLWCFVWLLLKEKLWGKYCVYIALVWHTKKIVLIFVKSISLSNKHQQQFYLLKMLFITWVAEDPFEVLQVWMCKSSLSNKQLISWKKRGHSSWLAWNNLPSCIIYHSVSILVFKNRFIFGKQTQYFPFKWNILKSIGSIIQ